MSYLDIGPFGIQCANTMPIDELMIFLELQSKVLIVEPEQPIDLRDT
jgi:hypothetical protein